MMHSKSITKSSNCTIKFSNSLVKPYQTATYYISSNCTIKFSNSLVKPYQTATYYCMYEFLVNPY